MAVTFLTNEDKNEMLLTSPQTLSDEQKSQARANIGVENSPLIVIMQEDGQGGYVGNYTPQECHEAATAGRQVLLDFDGTGSGCLFPAIAIMQDVVEFLYVGTNGDVATITTIALSEDKTLSQTEQEVPRTT